ncbi:MAG: 50S ribosomal protein L25 [bacterium]|nr:50S ribosomal protein L25 [bacterium]
MNQATENISLQVADRTTEGTAKTLRSKGIVPLILYGKKQEAQSLQTDSTTFTKLLHEHGTTTLLTLEDGPATGVKVLIREPQFDPVTNQVLHADLFAVNLTEKITATVPLVFEGESAAVEQLSGSLIESKAEVEVECLPQDIPHQLVVDVSKLATFEDVLHVSDLVIPDGVEVLDDPEEAIASVAEPRSEEELAALDEAVEEDVESIAAVEGKEGEEAAEGEEGAEGTEGAKPAEAAKGAEHAGDKE